MRTVEAIELLPGVSNEKLFNVPREIARAQEVLRRYIEPHAVLRWIRHQTESFLTEFGVGETLSIQPPYWSEVRLEGDKPQVFAFNVAEYGEQSGSYIHFGATEAIRDGLLEAYGLLGNADVDEGLIIVSPTEFYQDYGSRYDVVNLFRVTDVRGDGTRLVEGRYLLLNGKLASHERAFLLNWHNEKAEITANATPEEIVRSPQLFRLNQQELKSDDPLVHHTQTLRQSFRRQFGKELLGGETDSSVYQMIRSLVDSTLQSLFKSLSDRDAPSFAHILKDLMFRTQRQWAQGRGIDPESHIRDILYGRVQIGGIHPITDLSVRDELGMFFDGNTYGEGQRKRCVKHGEYDGDECPSCKKSNENS